MIEREQVFINTGQVFMDGWYELMGVALGFMNRESVFMDGGPVIQDGGQMLMDRV